jgi:hypothetical protein
VLSLLVVAGVADLCRAERAARGDKAPERTEKELPAPALFGRVSPSIVVIVASGKETAQGSGVVIAPGRVVTNNHVIAGAKKIEVRQGETRWPATLEAFDPKHDLAILAIEGFDRPRVTMRASTAVSVGERVYAVGAPRGLELTLSDGLISALRHDKPDKTPPGDKASAGDKASGAELGAAIIQTTVPISPGSSGGGLFDAQGRLIGITTLSAVGSQNLNFAYPTEWIEALRAPKAGAPGNVAAASPPPFTLSDRPKVLRCKIDTRTIWGLFSSGAEMLETKPATLDIEVTRFNSQTPAFSGAPAGEPAYGELVLADMNRDAGFIQFTGTETTRNAPDYFFAMDDDGRFRLTMLRGFDFHGQVRVRANSGACDPLEASKPPKPVMADAHSQERCEEAGDVDSCLAAGAAVETSNRMTALSLFMKGCDQERAGDRVAHAASVAQSCKEAARVCERLGFKSRAAELRARQTRVQARASGN